MANIVKSHLLITDTRFYQHLFLDTTKKGTIVLIELTMANN